MSSVVTTEDENAAQPTSAVAANGQGANLQLTGNGTEAKKKPTFVPTNEQRPWFESFQSGFIGDIVPLLAITHGVLKTKNKDGTMVRITSALVCVLVLDYAS